jgi:hypothetical protein
VLTKHSATHRSDLYSARRRYGVIPLTSLPSLKRTLEPRVPRATSHQRNGHPRSHALRTGDRRVGGCVPLIPLSLSRFPTASLKNVMAFCAVELARAGGGDVLIICKAQKRGTRYIVGRYNEKLSVGNLSCWRWLLSRSREHNRVKKKPSQSCLPCGPYFNFDNRSCFHLRQRLRKERSQ